MFGLCSVPGSAISGAILIKFFPGGEGHKLDRSALVKIDVVGSILSIGSAVMLLYGLQTGGTEFPWNDACIIGTLAAGIVTGILFFIYEWGLHRRSQTLTEPLLPMRLLKNPRICCLLLSVLNLTCLDAFVNTTNPREYSYEGITDFDLTGSRSFRAAYFTRPSSTSPN